jgi:hypothetical protein
LALPDAIKLVEEAANRLWEPEGRAALAYLQKRGLNDKTIRAARLGWTPQAIGVAWKPPGVVIPWHTDGKLSAVKIRPVDAWRMRFPKDKRPPKYIWGFRDQPTTFPDPETIRPGRPLIICEGEIDALLLAQELADLASVVTLGSASSRPDAAILMRLLPAAPWYIATDADDAGDNAASGWPESGIRVRPPAPHKDWGALHAAGFNLIRYIWHRILVPPTPWEEMTKERWGDAVGDPELGIVNDKPARGPAVQGTLVSPPARRAYP